ncbi:MAG: hypothetical protein WBM24_20710 [Candidatus Sulfotelmatobacter sp.]
MTIEHKIIIGVDDIKTVIVECKCGVRVSFPPDDVRIPENCPTPNCGIAWSRKSHGVSAERDAYASANLNFVDAIGQMRKHLKSSNFRILLEFEDESRALGAANA